MEKRRPTVFQVSLYFVLQPVFLVTSESAAETRVTWPLFLGGFDQNHHRHYRRRLHHVSNLSPLKLLSLELSIFALVLPNHYVHSGDFGKLKWKTIFFHSCHIFRPFPSVLDDVFNMYSTSSWFVLFSQFAKSVSLTLQSIKSPVLNSIKIRPPILGILHEANRTATKATSDAISTNLRCGRT
jgi:hypothetical protein